MSDAGHLQIAIAPGQVRITSTRPRNIAAVFTGRTPEDVMILLPRIFSVCGAAQAWAGRQCLAVAQDRVTQDISFAPSVVLAEALREHLMRIAVDWCRAVDSEPASPEALRRIFHLPRLAAEASDELQQESLALVQQWIGPPEAVLEGPDSFADRATVAARLIRKVVDSHWTSLGAAKADGERTALCLVAEEPCMKVLFARHGDGLLPRLYARLVHIARLLEGVQQGALPWSSRHKDGEWSIAHVATSRGQLTHHVRLHDGRVAAYRITAPTDVNFATGGPAERCLLKLASEGPQDISSPARLLVEAFDPCVSYEVRAA